MVVGIVGVVCAWVLNMPLIGLILGVIAIFLAASAFSQCPAGTTGHGMAVAGLVLGIVTVSLSGLIALCVCTGCATAGLFGTLAVLF